MQFTLAIVAFFAAAVSAQDPADLPACARPCFEDAVAITDCTGIEDFACLCASEEYNAAVTECVLGACSFADALAARAWADAACAA